MRFGSIKSDLLLGIVREELDGFKAGNIDSASFPNSLEAISTHFPSLTAKEQIELLRVVLSALTCNSDEKVELVVTAPNSFAIKTRTSLGMVDEVINSATKSIIITGYSVSEYVADFLNAIISKSMRGVLVQIYINNIDNQGSLEKLLRHQNKFLQIYNYTNDQDKMSALHAKIISVDEKKTLISSANLSYHGLSGNIEIGCYVESERFGKEVKTLFQQLYKEKVFRKHGI